MKKYFIKNLIILVTFMALSIASSAETNPNAGDVALLKKQNDNKNEARVLNSDLHKTDVSPKDFVHSYEIITALEGAVYRLTLPKFVYEGLIQSQGRDLAVFNSKAEIVPFTVREAARISHIVEHPEWSVPFYELPHDSRSEHAPGPLDVYVKTGVDGHIVSVQSGNRREEFSERRYILDFSSISVGNEIKRELRLSLPDVKLSARFSVFESTNLRDWSPLLTDAPLIQLKNEGSRLISDKVELPRTPRRYVLLRIGDVDQSFELEGVGYSVTVQSSSVLEEDSDIDGTFAAASGANTNSAVEYDALGAFPISKVNFVLQEPGFYKVAYFSRPEAKGDWLARGKAELSMIKTQDGEVRANAPVPVNLCEDRYWRIVFEGKFSGLPPRMRIYWRPSEINFLAQGGGPYVLAFGSSLKELSLQNTSFMKDANAAEAKIGSPIDQSKNPNLAPGGKKAGEVVNEESEWQRYLVWGLLILGGLLLSIMAIKLMKE